MTWRDDAKRTVLNVLVPRGDFDADDLRDIVGEPDPTHEPNAGNNAIGSVFRELAGRGLIESTGRVRKSRQPHRKGGMIQIWRGANRPADLWSSSA